MTSIPTVRQTTLLNEEGRGIWIVLAIPVAVASLPTLFLGIRRVRWIRVVAAALLGVFVLLGAFSVGTFYLPSAVAMAIAASSR